MLQSCKQKKDTLFTALSSEKTGIDFINSVADTDSFNILEYLYYYNGGGVAIADFNNDGFADIYFTSNQQSNKLYLNKGNLQFEDVTDKAGVQGNGNWKTGVTVADVNNDGLLDIYVCEVGKYKNFRGRNELFINNGNLTFSEQAKQFGLDIEGFNTQAVFFDYDNDGDLDMFLVNHSVHSTDTYVKADARLIKNEVSGDKLFRNDDGHFTEVTEEAKIYSSVIGYGLNVSVGDLNNDGWSDIYVTNDFHENDYYYINQQDGTFKEVNETAFGHESRFSMGSDIADINNDGWLDVMSLDMLPADEKILKSSAGDDPLEIFNYKLSYGYHYQYSRNCLQLNTGGGSRFMDIALYAGVAATDWSWAPLIADFDNDGIKDLFVSNGIVHRPNDLDYIKFSSSAGYEKAMEEKQLSVKDVINKMPNGNAHNYIFKGSDSLQYADKSVDWGFSEKSWSNGAAYADLDNDGDLDIVVNNLNEPSVLYVNNKNRDSSNHFINVYLKGYGKNKFAIGAKVILKENDGLQLGYVTTSKGFESSSLQCIHFGLKKNTVDTLQVIWPDGKRQTMYNVAADKSLYISYQPDSNFLLLPGFTGEAIVENITAGINLAYQHHENNFNDFNIQPLMLHAVSSEGPKLAVADLNNDGLDDFYVCGAKYQAGSLFIQDKTGKFNLSDQPDFKNDSLCEDVNAVFFDADGDGDKDLYVVSGGNQTENEPSNVDRLYINDGKHFIKSSSLPALFGNKSIVVTADLDQDGDQDIFVGGRVVAGRYGETPGSYLLINDGKGNFVVRTEELSPGLNHIGMVTGAAWIDLDKDKWPDLILAGEWMPITVFQNRNGKLFNATTDYGLTATSGLWSALHVEDINGDGYDDVLAGNLGTNSKLTASEKFPLLLYYGDFDNNGTADQIFATAKEEKYYPFLGKEELENNLPSIIKKKYLEYGSFAGQTIKQVFGDKLNQAKKLQASILSSVALVNNKKKGFEIASLPTMTQLSRVMTFYTTDFNKDGAIDIFTAGNFYGASPFEGRYDASYGTVLLNKGQGHFKEMSNLNSGVQIDGEVRDIKSIRSVNGSVIIAVARNNNSMDFYRTRQYDSNRNNHTQ